MRAALVAYDWHRRPEVERLEELARLQKIVAFVRRDPTWCLLDHRTSDHGLTVLWHGP